MADSIEQVIRGLGRLAWERFGDRFAFDTDLLLAKLDPILDFESSTPRTPVGILCTACGWSSSKRRFLRRAATGGLIFPCPRCGSESSLSRYYSSDLPTAEIAKALGVRYVEQVLPEREQTRHGAVQTLLTHDRDDALTSWGTTLGRLPAIGIPPCGELPPRMASWNSKSSLQVVGADRDSCLNRSWSRLLRSRDRHQQRLLPDLLDWELPHRGPPLDDCGKRVWWGCLNTEGRGHGGRAFVTVRKHSCDRPRCKVCTTGWEAKETRRASRRIERGVEILQQGLPVHVVASPPQDSDFGTLRDYRRLRSKANAILKLAGYKGGALIFHPWRCKYTGQWSPEKDGPHFHSTAVGWNEDTAGIYRRTGWVVHAIQEPDETGLLHVRVLRDRDAVARVLHYCLTHAGLAMNLETGHSLEALTWWGSFATSKLRLPPEVELALPEELCPHCAAPLARVVWLTQEADPPPSGLIDPESVGLAPFAYLEGARRRVAATFRAMMKTETDQSDRGWSATGPPSGAVEVPLRIRRPVE